LILLGIRRPPIPLQDELETSGPLKDGSQVNNHWEQTY
jgi:hypothetical protein